MTWTKISLSHFITLFYFTGAMNFCVTYSFLLNRVVGTEERIPIPLMDYILNVVRLN